MCGIGLICLIIGLCLPNRKLAKVGAILMLLDLLLSVLLIGAAHHH